MSYILEYLFGQFGPAVMAVSPPSFLCHSSLCHRQDTRSRKVLDLVWTLHSTLIFLVVAINIFLVLYPAHNSIPAFGKKINKLYPTWKQDYIHPLVYTICILPRSHTLQYIPSNHYDLSCILICTQIYHSHSIQAIPPKCLLSFSPWLWASSIIVVLQGRRECVWCLIVLCWSQH